MTTAEASAEDDRWVVAGADTHTDTIHVAAVDPVGRELGDREFPTTPTGYDAALTVIVQPRRPRTAEALASSAAADSARSSADSSDESCHGRLLQIASRYR